MLPEASDVAQKALVLLFQWAPTLGGECYPAREAERAAGNRLYVSMGTHPWG